jgi:hypothetical protein
VVGHTRWAAAKDLGITEVPVLIASDLTEEQCRAYRIMDNRSNEKAEWDMDLLVEELKSLEDYDLSLTGFNDKEIEELFADPGQTRYTTKVDTPVYTPQGEKPSLESLVDEERYLKLIEDIDDSSAPDAVKDFLKKSAARHRAFDYQLIAEYYCHCEPEIQRLFEDSALVIIDFERAIELGYVQLNEDLKKNYIDEYLDDNE